MKNVMLGLLAAACVVGVVITQATINPTEPQPTCNMCPGTLIPLSELEAYTTKAKADVVVIPAGTGHWFTKIDET